MVNEALDVMLRLRDEGMTMVVVSHEMGFAKAAADRVVFMSDGKIVEDAPPEKFFGNPEHARTPPVPRPYSLIASPQWPVGGPIHTIHGRALGCGADDSRAGSSYICSGRQVDTAQMTTRSIAMTTIDHHG
jgi:ABC-type sulfate/molybdate transport systems ATPase subunit